MKELFIKYFLKLMFLHENIMDKKVQYILLVFVGLWFVCCFLRFTSSIIFSKIIPLIFALCMLVFSVLSLISFQWVYWMMWLIMAWGILITEDIHMHSEKNEDLKRITHSESIYRCKCESLEKNIQDLRIYNSLLEKNLKNKEKEYNDLVSNANIWQRKVQQFTFENDIAKGDIRELQSLLHSTEIPELRKQIDELEEEKNHFRLLYERAEWQLNHSKKTNQEVDVFKNCDSLERLSKRKKALLSIFHPDAECGDNEITRIILEQYNKMKATYQ